MRLHIWCQSIFARQRRNRHEQPAAERTGDNILQDSRVRFFQQGLELGEAFCRRQRVFNQGELGPTETGELSVFRQTGYEHVSECAQSLRKIMQFCAEN